MRCLLAGEQRPPGSGAYLIAVLKALGASFTHVPASSTLTPRTLRTRYDVLIFSDYPCARAPGRLQDAAAEQVRHGTGALMIGGWGSFSGPVGRWRGSRIEALLPVRCLPRDDRVRCPSGALMLPSRPHPLLHGVSFLAPPVVCGLNALLPRAGSQVVLRAHPLRATATPSRGVGLLRVSYPLLVVGAYGAGRTAALATDAAPHWCGGFVDWGPRMVRVRIAPGRHVEVGAQYLAFFRHLLRWLATPRLTRSQTNGPA